MWESSLEVDSGPHTWLGITFFFFLGVNYQDKPVKGGQFIIINILHSLTLEEFKSLLKFYLISKLDINFHNSLCEPGVHETVY